MTLNIIQANSQRERQVCLRLRHIVFVEEQGVPVEMEIDAYDADHAIHFLGNFQNEPAAASRICVFDNVAKIQRMVVLVDFRGNGFGRDMMIHMLDHIRRENLAPTVALDAQTYAQGFYETLGFVAQGDVFDDAGIPHIHMRQPS